MSTDNQERDTETFTVRVPVELAEDIEEVWEDRGYASRSEFIRDALRNAVNPPITLSEDVLEDIAVSRRQAERGETLTPDEVWERLDLE